ncbi:MAG: hypothetical protein ACO1SX_07285 [Actinomycetota bacterium]
MLIPCPACDHRISIAALACVNCGHPMAISASPTQTIPLAPAASAGSPGSEPELLDAAPDSPPVVGPVIRTVHTYERPDGFEPPPHERFMRRMGRYALNAVLLVAAQLAANALLKFDEAAQYLSPTTIDVLRSTISMSLWWLWVCKTRPSVRAERSRQVPGSFEAAALMLAQAAFAWLPRLLGDRGFYLSTYWGTGPIIDSVIWIGLAAGVLLGRPGFRDVAAFNCWFRMLIFITRYLSELGGISLGLWLPPGLLVAVAGTNFGLLLLLGGSPGRVTRYVGIGVFIAALFTAVAMALTSPSLDRYISP